jgi:hypothetical protein
MMDAPRGILVAVAAGGVLWLLGVTIIRLMM